MTKDWEGFESPWEHKVPAEALEQPTCSKHPDAPHGFCRDASHSADRYVCECEEWEPPSKEWQGLSDEEINLLDLQHTKYKTHYDKNKNMDILIKSINCIEFSRAIENKLKEKNT